MEDQLGAILGNPALMQQIMDMAQSLGQSTPPTQTEPPQQPFPEIDPATIGNIMSIAGKTQIDRNQKALLHALRPRQFAGHAKTSFPPVLGNTIIVNATPGAVKRARAELKMHLFSEKCGFFVSKADVFAAFPSKINKYVIQ